MRAPDTLDSQLGRRPLPNPPPRRPGEVLYRLRHQRGENAYEAVKRAASMSWWHLVRRGVAPYLSAGWWCWPGRQRPSRGGVITGGG